MGINDLLFNITNVRVRQGSFAHIGVSEVIDSDVLILHEGSVRPEITRVKPFLVIHHVLAVLFCFNHHNIGLLEEKNEHVDLLLVFGDLHTFLALVNLEAHTILLENLHGILLWDLTQLFVDFTTFASKDLELP